MKTESLTPSQKSAVFSAKTALRHWRRVHRSFPQSVLEREAAEAVRTAEERAEIALGEPYHWAEWQ